MSKVKVGTILEYQNSIYRITKLNPGGVMGIIIKTSEEYYLPEVAITYAYLKHNEIKFFYKEENPELFL